MQLRYKDVFTVNANSKRIIDITAKNLGFIAGIVLFTEVHQYLETSQTIYPNIEIAYVLRNDVVTSEDSVVLTIVIYNGNNSSYNIPIISRALVYNQ